MRFGWIDERPFGYRDADGIATGCDLALARAACARLDEPFEPVHTTFAELLPGLADGRWDVTTGMFVTPSRRRSAHFTRPVWSLRDGLLVRREDPAGADATDAAPEFTGYRSLAAGGGRLAVLRDQEQIRHAAACGVPDARLLVLDGYEQARAAVLDGRAVAYASVALAHEQHLAAHPDEGLRCVVVPADEAPASVGGFACSDPAVAAALDPALDALLPQGPPAEPSPDPSMWPTSA